MRILEVDLAGGKVMKDVTDIAEKFRDLAAADSEYIVIQLLSKHGNDMGAQLLSIGTEVTGSFEKINFSRHLVLSGASAVVLIHNHPLGDPKPSKADKDLTEFLINTTELLGMNFYDHIIIGRDAFYSFEKNNTIKYKETK